LDVEWGIGENGRLSWEVMKKEKEMEIVSQLSVKDNVSKNYSFPTVPRQAIVGELSFKIHFGC